MSKLDDVLMKVKKDYGKNLIGKLEETKKEYKRIPLVTPALAYLFRGGLPRTIIELVGAESSGKSSCSYAICGMAQKILKEEYEEELQKLQSIDKPTKDQKEQLAQLLERGYQKVVYLDHEFSSDPEWMEKNGVDVEDLIYIRPEGQTAEQLFQIILDLMDSGGVGCVVLDSIPAFVSKQAAEKTMEEKTYAGISGPLSVFSDKMMPLQKKYGILFIGVNQPRDDMVGYHRLITPGGRMWKHACSIRLLFKKGDYYDEKYAILKAHPEEAAGNYVEVEVVKNKATKPDRRMCKFSITYDKGVDGYNDTINLAIAFGIITKAGAWFSIIDNNGEVLVDTDNAPMKWQGLSNVLAYMRTHEEEYKEIYNKVCKLIEQN